VERKKRSAARAATLALTVWGGRTRRRGDGDLADVVALLQRWSGLNKGCPGESAVVPDRDAHVHLPCSDGAQAVDGSHARVRISQPDCWVQSSRPLAAHEPTTTHHTRPTPTT
jgi:hypothetical protein